MISERDKKRIEKLLMKLLETDYELYRSVFSFVDSNYNEDGSLNDVFEDIEIKLFNHKKNEDDPFKFYRPKG